MEWPKLKNIILLVLLLANVFLLALVLTRNSQTAQSREEALRNIQAVMEGSGISLKLDPFPSEKRISALTLRRDTTMELQIVRSLLGQAETENLGGGLTRYTGENGTATFRSNGEFSVELKAGVLPLEEDPRGAVRRLIRAMGIEAETNDLKLVESDGLLRTTVTQKAGGYPVFDCGISFSWQDGSLLAISGRRLAGVTAPLEDGEESIAAETALLRFLAQIKKAGDICSEITEMTLGYRFSSSLSDTLEPVWLIGTDTGLYYIGTTE